MSNNEQQLSGTSAEWKAIDELREGVTKLVSTVTVSVTELKSAVQQTNANIQSLSDRQSRYEQYRDSDGRTRRQEERDEIAQREQLAHQSKANAAQWAAIAVTVSLCIGGALLYYPMMILVNLSKEQVNTAEERVKNSEKYNTMSATAEGVINTFEAKLDAIKTDVRHNQNDLHQIEQSRWTLAEQERYMRADRLLEEEQTRRITDVQIRVDTHQSDGHPHTGNGKIDALRNAFDEHKQAQERSEDLLANKSSDRYTATDNRFERMIQSMTDAINDSLLRSKEYVK